MNDLADRFAGRRLDALLDGSKAASPSARLWPGLAGRPKRRLPLKGLDAVAERARGVAGRRRAGRKVAARANAILEEARTIADLGDEGFFERVREARSAIRLSRDDAKAIDRAYALCVEAVRRTQGFVLHPEQVMGALVMADGCCAELATGEGKTVTAILPATIDGWVGRGVHVMTVNDYLARRDAETTGPAYALMGLRVGVLTDQTKPEDRAEAYRCDITYMADKQAIFDFLRDRLVGPVQPRLGPLLMDELFEPARMGEQGAEHWRDRIVQRGQYSAIVDEADSVLIDEAVTPAIIGADTELEGAGAEAHGVAAQIASTMAEGKDYSVDRRLKRVRLTSAGREKVAKAAEGLPPFWSGPRRREELVQLAVKARELYLNGRDYLIREGEVTIVDRSTGRLLEGRRWQLGVHQAVEAKEGLKISGDRSTSARISYQQFFQQYRRLSGMSGTVWEVADELWRDYRLPVVRIPTHKPVIRKHASDRVFATEEAKFRAVAARVAELNAKGSPVLVGSRSVSDSERLGLYLQERGVDCRILNATREAEEAEIVAQAGRSGSVTVATNMAGRGTDITLDEETRRLGGLVVIATERNDERRVDRQLYGRAGRQGDPGRAETFVSLEDALIKEFGFDPLTVLCRLSPGPLRRVSAALLWPLAQRTASGRLAVRRAEAAKSEAWIDVAMHNAAR